jgi:5-formyltetrahydrofolate cyclo-ligase
MEDDGSTLPSYLKAQKEALRAAMKTRRHAAWLDAPDAGLALRDSFLRSFTLPEECVVGVYSAKGDEIDPLPLAIALSLSGHCLCLPVIVEKGGVLLFREWKMAAPLVRGVLDILEPPPEAVALEPDVLLVPLLAFDRFGNRIGYGGGYYDRTLRGLWTRKKIITIGLAYAAQEEDSVPVSDGDFRLDAVVTEKGVRAAVA